MILNICNLQLCTSHIVILFDYKLTLDTPRVQISSSLTTSTATISVIPSSVSILSSLSFLSLFVGLTSDPEEEDPDPDPDLRMDGGVSFPDTDFSELLGNLSILFLHCTS